MSAFRRPRDGEFLLPGATRRRNNMVSQLLRNGNYSDFRITCQRTDFDVHRVILMGHSAFLDRVIDGSFAEGVQQKLDLPTLKSATVDVVLCWIYEPDNFDIDQYVTGQDWTQSIARWTQTIDVHCVADMWTMPVLKKYIEEQIRARLYRHFLDPNILPSDQLMRHFNDVLRTVFSDKHVSMAIKQIFSWTLARMNTLNPQRRTDAQMDTLVRTHPEIGGYLYRHLREVARLAVACRLCQTNFVDGFDPRWMPVNEWHTDHYKLLWKYCQCGFRGIDGLDCHTDDRAILNHPTFCQSCRDVHMDTPEAVEGVLDQRLYLVDGELIIEDDNAVNHDGNAP